MTPPNIEREIMPSRHCEKPRYFRRAVNDSAFATKSLGSGSLLFGGQEMYFSSNSASIGNMVIKVAKKEKLVNTAWCNVSRVTFMNAVGVFKMIEERSKRRHPCPEW